MKQCTKCQIIKPLEEFPWRDKAHSQRRGECKACKREYVRKHHAIASNRDKKRKRERRRYHQNVQQERERARLKYHRNVQHITNKKFQRLYGLTLTDVEVLSQKQNNACAICRRQSYSKLCVDHNHITGNVRGLLCRQCNFALGLLRDDIDIVKSLLNYLVHYDKQT
jgi:hypothetical protein